MGNIRFDFQVFLFIFVIYLNSQLCTYEYTTIRVYYCHR
jgi:hypothetical protein